jgi:arylsulfatase A-like enzyme
MNVLWIVIDALRRDRLGCYGYVRPTTPNLDRLAGGAVRFDQVISPHIPTHPAHTTLFSGRDVFAHQVVAQGGKVSMAEGVPLLPALLRDRGFFTAAVDNIGLWIQRAFERYEKTSRWDHNGTRPWRNGEEVTGKAVKLLREAAGRK